ncbi:CHASE2 domain-containing protein [Dyella sp.]|uniref:CHASE2 domain-containing protein n=1 Tax=Dyella sp. TaxID=1869338 RepID=UPI002D780DDE|nr:CHASE2 domain-containing protein [Dyella sp.]HET7332477.1 CHASE2 domain-containing protein [Dyella sp.]
MPTAFAWLVRGMLWMVGIGLVVLLIVSGLTVPLDNALYDLHARYWRYTPDDRVVIVAIDPKSLDEIGRFPWPRSVHAQLIDRLTTDGVRGIGMDVTMSTPSDDPANDLLVAAAMHRNGKVVLPAFAEAVNLGGPLQEALPVPAIAQSAAALGQVDVAKDSDERVRGAYLKAGLGSAYWPSLALALLQLGHDAPTTLPGLHDPLHNDASPYLWMRDNYVLLRYAGPLGTFGSLSYTDVLNNRVPANLLKDRWVLVGAIAEGLGDILQTPQSPMPGVEYQANVLESLERGLLVTPLDFLHQLALSAALLAVPLLLYGLPGVGRNWALPVASMLLVVAACFALLRGAYLWWPPSSCLVVILVEFAAWQLLTRDRHSNLAP